MSQEFNADQARENFKNAKSDYEEIYQRILNGIEYSSKKGINPAILSLTTSTITQENINEMISKLNQLGFTAEINKDSQSSIWVKVGF